MDQAGRGVPLAFSGGAAQASLLSHAHGDSMSSHATERMNNELCMSDA